MHRELASLVGCACERRDLVLGEGASELIHIGQAVMGLGGTVDFLVESVFNYPTLAEAYKVAALDAANKLRAVRQLAG